MLRSDSPVLVRMMVCSTGVSAAMGPKSQAGGEIVRTDAAEAAGAGKTEAKIRQSSAVRIVGLVPILA